MLNIESLISRIKTGDSSAQWELRGLVQKIIKPEIKRFSNLPESPEDLVAETTDKIYSIIMRKSSTGELKITHSYLRKIAHNLLIKKYNKQKKSEPIKEGIIDSRAPAPGGKEYYGPDIDIWYSKLPEEERQGIERAVNLVYKIYAFKKDYSLKKKARGPGFSKKILERDGWRAVLDSFKKLDKDIAKKFDIQTRYYLWKANAELSTYIRVPPLSEEEKLTYSETEKNPLIKQILEIYEKIYRLYLYAAIETAFYLRIEDYLSNDFFGKPNRSKPMTLPEGAQIIIEMAPDEIGPFEAFEKLPKLRITPPRLLYDVLTRYFRRGKEADAEKIRFILYYLRLYHNNEKSYLFHKIPTDWDKFKKYFKMLRIGSYKPLDFPDFYDRLVNRIITMSFPGVRPEELLDRSRSIKRLKTICLDDIVFESVSKGMPRSERNKILKSISEIEKAQDGGRNCIKG